MRFSDDVSSLCSLHEVLRQRTSTPDLSNIAQVLGAFSQELQKEWEFIQRLDGDLSSEKQMITIATSSQYIRMYPTFSDALRRLLFLPVATATVERSFSTLNRILSDRPKRCRLTPDHRLRVISCWCPLKVLTSLMYVLVQQKNKTTWMNCSMPHIAVGLASLVEARKLDQSV